MGESVISPIAVIRLIPIYINLDLGYHQHKLIDLLDGRCYFI